MSIILSRCQILSRNSCSLAQDSFVSHVRAFACQSFNCFLRNISRQLLFQLSFMLSAITSWQNLQRVVVRRQGCGSSSKLNSSLATTATGNGRGWARSGKRQVLLLLPAFGPGLSSLRPGLLLLRGPPLHPPPGGLLLSVPRRGQRGRRQVHRRH